MEVYNIPLKNVMHIVNKLDWKIYESITKSHRSSIYSPSYSPTFGLIKCIIQTPPLVPSLSNTPSFLRISRLLSSAVALKSTNSCNAAFLICYYDELQ